MGQKWYVARTEPRAEVLAAAELVRDGYEIFFPRIKSPDPRPGRTDMPLFPGYIFLRCDPEAEGWPSFRSVHRIAGWVSFGGEVPCLPDEAVAELMERWETINRQGGFLKLFEPGEKVRILGGSLVGFAEIVEKIKLPQRRAKVLLEFMGRLVQAQVPLEYLQPANGAWFQERPIEKPKAVRRTRGQGRWIRGLGPRALAGT